MQAGYFVGTVIVFLIAGFIVWRIKPRTIHEGIFGPSAYVISFAMLVVIIINVLPNFFMRQQANMSNWQPVFDQATGTGQQVWTTAADLIGMGGQPVADIPLPIMSTAVSMAVAPVVTATPQAVTADIGAGIILPPPGEPHVAVPVTLTMKIEYYGQLAQAKAQGNRVAGSAIVASILAIDPSDPQALAEKTALDVAAIRITNYQALANVPISVFIDEQYRAQVAGVLGGGAYYVKGDGGTLRNVSCQETAVIVDITEGWTYGTEIVFPRCYLSQFRAMDTGDRFSVAGR